MKRMKIVRIVKLSKKKNIFLKTIAFIFLVFSVIGCGQQDFTPKPRGYFRIDLPEKNYIQYDGDCPFTFAYPTYAKIIKDSQSPTEKCWFNIVFPENGGIIHTSYKEVDNNLNAITEDARALVYKHTVKAEGINEQVYYNPAEEKYGILYDIKGNAASSIQFFLTDSAEHFFRGALYFETTPNYDSLSPLISFYRKDILHLMETFKWKE